MSFLKTFTSMFCTYIVTLCYINGSAECMSRKYIAYYLMNLLECIVHIFLEVDVDIVFGGEVIVEKSKYIEGDKSCTISSTSK